MKGFMIRVWFVVSIAFIGFIGYAITGIGVLKLYFFAPQEMITLLQQTNNPEVYAFYGSLLFIITFVVFISSCVFVPFSTKIRTPKNVHRLNAQGMTVYLIDGTLYTTKDAELRTLKDLSRIRLQYKYSLLYYIISVKLIIADNVQSDIVVGDLTENVPEIL